MYHSFINIKSTFNACIQDVCQGKICERPLRNKARVKLHGRFDEVLRENTWLCENFPLTFHEVRGNEDKVYVSELLEHEETGVKCEFIMTWYGFWAWESEIELYCSDKEDYEFFGPGLY